MVFKCQEDCFLKYFETKVVSCEPATMKWIPNGSSEAVELNGFNVICEDTILFPEGGGQPCDYGTINGDPVRNVLRKGSTAIHFVESSQPLKKGDEVKQYLNWERRLDHMQQHSGQHLITELFERQLGFETTSWWLGHKISSIELNSMHVISREMLDTIENMANYLIREGKEVNVVLVDPKSDEMKAARARDLPKDVEGPVRLIRIEGQRDNMCCGTHVNNLSQLQCVKILYSEKNKNSVNVYFVAGQRVINILGECFEREQQLNHALKGGPNQHLELIEKMQNNLKASRKIFQKLLKDTAAAEAAKLSSMPKPLPHYYSVHRNDGIEPDFINTFLKSAPGDVTLYFLTVSEPSIGKQPAKGQIVLRGNPEVVQHFGPKFLEILDGKGNGKGGNFQGKFNRDDKITECEAMLQEYFKDKTNGPAQGS